MVLFKAKDYIPELDLIIKNKFEKLNTESKLGVVYIGKNHDFQKFVSIKKSIAESYGIELEEFSFNTSTKKSQILDAIKKIGVSDEYGGIVVQYPFPAKYSYNEISELINPKKDVDFFSPEVFGKFVLGCYSEFMPPTVRALDFLLNNFKLEIRGQKCVVIGQGVLVGRPISFYLMNKGATLISLNEHSRQKRKVLEDADLVITATGSASSLRGEWLKRGASLIDFSSNILGSDFDKMSDYSHLNLVSLSPGGMGPLTVRFLFLNFLEFIERSWS